MDVKLNQLQVFLLVFAKLGVSTPYELQAKAGMSVGLTSPALKTLEKMGFMKSTPGPRNRLSYSLTKSGETALHSAISQFPRERRLEKATLFDAIPRTMILAWLNSGIWGAKDVMEEGVEKLEALSLIREREAGALALRQAELLREVRDEWTVDRGDFLGITYRLIRATFEAQQFHLQSQALLQLAGIIEKFPEERFLLPSGAEDELSHSSL